MSVLPKESLKIIAESINIPKLSDEVAAALAPDVEYRLREIIQEAMKFMKHSRREVLTTDDINSALRLRNIEGLYGFSSNNDPLHFCRAVGTSDLYFVDNKELEFYELINSPVPQAPLDVSFNLHWLAVEGIQPQIPQNPSPAEIFAAQKKRRLLPAQEKTAEIKPIVKHVISKELQLYYEKITEAIKGADDALVDAALNSLSRDPGLHPLLPYLTAFISDEVTHNIRNLRVLKNMMRMVRAILDSPYFHVDPYLHQLMPSILTCIVGRRLCEAAQENHWELRDYAANITAHICQKYGKSYTTLQPRLTKTLSHAFLDLQKPLTTHYGAIVGLTALGFHVIHRLLLPNMGPYVKILKETGLDPNSKSSKFNEANKVYYALLNAVRIFLATVAKESSTLSETNENTADTKPMDTSDDSAKETTTDVKNSDLPKYVSQLKALFGDDLNPYLPSQS